MIAIISVMSIFSGCNTTVKDTDENTQEKNSPTHSIDQRNKTETNTSDQKRNKKSQSDENKVNATVTDIVDGDTIDIRIHGKEETVRLLLVDTPETVHPSKPVQKFGPEASQFAKEKLLGENVQVEYDGPKRDKYDRLLAYIWIDDKMFNQMLLEQGLARYAYVYDPPYEHSQNYKKAESNAQRQEKGIWSIEGYVTSDGFVDRGSQTSNKQDDQNNSNADFKFDPSGVDRDCSDFNTQAEAQKFYEAAGGPSKDPHRLDGNDQDGLVCESL